MPPKHDALPPQLPNLSNLNTAQPYYNTGAQSFNNPLGLFSRPTQPPHTSAGTGAGGAGGNERGDSGSTLLSKVPGSNSYDTTLSTMARNSASMITPVSAAAYHPYSLPQSMVANMANLAHHTQYASAFNSNNAINIHRQMMAMTGNVMSMPADATKYYQNYGDMGAFKPQRLHSSLADIAAQMHKKKANLACHFCDHAARRPGRQKTALLVACQSPHCRKVFCSRPSCYKKLPAEYNIHSPERFAEWKRQIDHGIAGAHFTCPHCKDEAACPGPQCAKRWRKRQARMKAKAVAIAAQAPAEIVATLQMVEAYKAEKEAMAMAEGQESPNQSSAQPSPRGNTDTVAPRVTVNGGTDWIRDSFRSLLQSTSNPTSAATTSAALPYAQSADSNGSALSFLSEAGDRAAKTAVVGANTQQPVEQSKSDSINDTNTAVDAPANTQSASAIQSRAAAFIQAPYANFLTSPQFSPLMSPAPNQSLMQPPHALNSPVLAPLSPNHITPSFFSPQQHPSMPSMSLTTDSANATARINDTLLFSAVKAEGLTQVESSAANGKQVPAKECSSGDAVSSIEPGDAQ